MKLKTDFIISHFVSFVFTILVWLSMTTSVRKGLALYDASIFEYFGYAMNHGQIMYTNLFDHKGPFIFIFNALGYFVAGPLGIKALYLLCVYLFFYWTYRISQLFSSKIISVFVNVIVFIIFEKYFEGGWGLEGYILPCISYSLFVFLKYSLTGKSKPIEIILNGVFFSIVFFTKANMVGMWLFFSLYITICLLYRKKVKELFQLIGFFISGILLILIPLFLYLMMNDALTDMFYQSFIVNMIYSKQPSEYSLKEVIEWYLLQTNQLQINILIVLSSLLALKKYHWKVIAYNILVIFCIVVALVSKRTYFHYLLVLIPLYVPYISIFMDHFNSYLSKYGIVILLIGMCIIYYHPLKEIKYNISHRYQDLSVNEREVANYIRTHTYNDDRIYSHRMNGIIYLESDRLASTKFFFIPSLKDETPLIDDFKNSILNNPPKYIVFDSRWDYRRLTDEFIKEYIKEHYDFEKEIESMSIYKFKNN